MMPPPQEHDVTVQGGGGGRKVPPGSTPGPTPPARTDAAAAKKPTTPPTPAPPTASPPPSRADAFEVHRTDPRMAERTAPPTGELPSTSGIDSMVRVLEDTRTQILDEHRALRAKIQRLVGELVAGGFERSLLDERRAELNSVRQRMAALRRRLQQIQRRLKTVMGKTRHADAELGKQLSSQLDRLRKLEPGLQRALLALQMMEAAFVDPWSGSQHKIVGDVDAEARGSALARTMPGQAVAAGIARLLAEGTTTEGAPEPEEPTTTTTTTDAGSDRHGLAHLRALTDALKGSL